MGACASCLGHRRQEAHGEDDGSRLLNDDLNNMHYGSFGQQQITGQDDPLEAQREIEALQRVVARTSDNMVDIFEIAPQDGHIPRAVPFPDHDTRLARYENLLSKLSSDDPSLQPPSLSSTASTKVDWIPWEEDTLELQHGAIVVPLKVEAGAPLVGTFADAAAAVAAS